MLEDVLNTLVGIFSKAPAFFEFKLDSSFLILDTLISVKWNKDWVHTFSSTTFTFR